MVVGAERAISDDFQTYLGSLVKDNKLARVVIDECHLIISADYREKLKELKILRAQPVQMVLMTATMPPSREQEFERKMLMAGEARWVRSPTMRTNFVYRVEQSQYPGTLEEEAYSYVQRRVNVLLRSERAVVYCRTTAQCEELAKKLECDCYYAGRDGNKEAFSRWISGVHKVMVATGALGWGPAWTSKGSRWWCTSASRTR